MESGKAGGVAGVSATQAGAGQPSGEKAVRRIAARWGQRILREDFGRAAEVFTRRSTRAARRFFQKSGIFFSPLRARIGFPAASFMSPSHPNLGSTLQTRPTLLFRVRVPQDSASWGEFHRLYRRLIYGRARRAGLSHEEAEDVAQEVFQRVAATIHEFDLNPERGSFRGWLMQLTRWRIADQFARRRGLPPQSPASCPDATGQRTATIERVPAPAAEDDEWDREWEEHLLAAALARLARQVKPRHFQVFDLYLRQHWPVRRVAKELGVGVASVYVIAHRCMKLLKSEVARLRQQLS